MIHVLTSLSCKPLVSSWLKFLTVRLYSSLSVYYSFPLHNPEVLDLITQYNTVHIPTPDQLYTILCLSLPGPRPTHVIRTCSRRTVSALLSFPFPRILRNKLCSSSAGPFSFDCHRLSCTSFELSCPLRIVSFFLCVQSFAVSCSFSSDAALGVFFDHNLMRESLLLYYIASVGMSPRINRYH